MTDLPLILGIDQGTSSTKCLLVDAEGAVVGRGQAPVGEAHPRPGWVEQDAEAISASVRAAVADCVRPDLARRVVAVGLSTQRESITAWDRVSGKPLTPLLSWQDRRTAPMAREIGGREAPARVRALSGLPLDPMFSALKARWILDAVDPDRVRAKTGALVLGTVDSWIMSSFGGASLIETGNASRTQLLDIDTVAWSAELLDLFGIPATALPRVVGSTGPFPKLRGLPPLPDGVPLLAVMADSHAALYGHGARQPGDVKATQGTGSSVMGLVEAKADLDPGVCKTIAWAIGGPAYAAEGNIRAAGATLRWVASVLGTSVEDLAGLAAGADREGVCLVPGFNGLGAPWWDDQAVAVLANFTLGTSRGAIARAALDSIAQQIADVVEAIDRSGTAAARLFVDGGPTGNDQLMQIEADLIGRPVWRGTTAELSALGVVHLAGLRAGVWSEAELASRRLERDVFVPRLGEAERQASRDGWRDAVERARSHGRRPAQPADRA